MGSEYVADMVMNHEEDVTFLPFLALKNVKLFLRSTSNQGESIANLVNVFATAMMLVHESSLTNAHPSSKIINAFQINIVVLVNQIVVHNSSDAVKAAAREIVLVIILAVMDD